MQTYKVWSHCSPGAVYKAKAPPSATPAIAITAVRNGSRSIGTVALEDLEAEGPGEDDVDLEEALVLLALPLEDDAKKSSQRNTVIESVDGMIHTSAFLLLKLKSSLLVRSCAICSEAARCSSFEACTVADTTEVGAAEAV